MEAFRTFLIWMVQFALFYGLRTSKDPEVYKFRMAGEEWTTGAWVQLGGFLLMTFSLFTYNGIPHYPCFNYGPIHIKGEEVTQELTGQSEKFSVVFEDRHVAARDVPLLQGRNQGKDAADQNNSAQSQFVGERANGQS
jgi:hypothetical protein